MKNRPMHFPTALLLLAAIVAHSSHAQTAETAARTPAAATAPTAVPALVPFSGLALAADSGAPEPGMWDLRDLYATPAAWTAEHDRVADQPTSSRTQVHILAAHHADIFDAVPGIIIGHADRHDRFRRGYGYRGGGV